MQETRRIAVAGATGRVGHHLVDVLQARGQDVVPMSRSTGVDVITGHGLANALSGVDCIVDVATGPSAEEEPATEFFVTAARNLHQAGKQAGVRRIVVVSIIACDKFVAGYTASKAAHERAMLAGPIPISILRAAQFHEFVEQLVDWGRQGELAYVQRMRTQLVAARSVAEGLADLATGPEPVPGSIVELAGPRVENLVEVAGLLVTRRGDSLRIEGVSNPADPDRELYENGGLLPGSSATIAGPTFEEWLSSAA